MLLWPIRLTLRLILISIIILRLALSEIWIIYYVTYRWWRCLIAILIPLILIIHTSSIQKHVLLRLVVSILLIQILDKIIAYIWEILRFHLASLTFVWVRWFTVWIILLSFLNLLGLILP